MPRSAPEIINEILSHIQNHCNGKLFKNYYVGITNNMENRLFGDHNVPRKGHCYIYREAVNIDSARIAEEGLLAKGMKGGSGGGDDDSVFVYCYEIGNSTKE
jgi:hypothetical protein